jgi:Phosphotransferase enzyme family
VVHRETGPWTPAVHALLAYLDGRVRHVPAVRGFDEQGREILSYLPGRVVDIDTEELTEPQIVGLVGWARGFHDAVVGFRHPGPWRFPALGDELVGHNDIAPYNACFDGDRLVGVFDWDLAGPTTRLMELAFMAWNCVPLWRPMEPDRAAARLTVLTTAYGSFAPAQVLAAVPARIGPMLTEIPRAAGAGDVGMQHLMRQGEPARSRAALDGLVERTPAIRAHLR